MERPRNLTHRTNIPEKKEEEMNIYLKVMKTIAFKVKRSDTIKGLKQKFRQEEGTPDNLQELFFDGEKLKDNLTLAECRINKNSTLHLYLQHLAGLKVFVKIPSKLKTVTLEVKISDTIQNIKTMIQSKEGFKLDQFSLFYTGKQLESSMTLASHGIKNESTLYLLFNPKDSLSINVKLQNGEILALEVKVLYTVGDLKELMGSMIGASFYGFRFSYGEKELEEGKTLACYDIKEGSILTVLPPLHFQVFVKMPDGISITLDVEQGDTVKDLKQKISKKSKLPVKMQKISYGRKVLSQNQDLAKCNIQKDTTLHVSLARSCNILNR